MELLQGFDDGDQARILQQVAGRPRLEGLEDLLVIFIDGEHHELGVGALRPHFADAFDAIHGRWGDGKAR